MAWRVLGLVIAAGLCWYVGRASLAQWRMLAHMEATVDWTLAGIGTLWVGLAMLYGVTAWRSVLVWLGGTVSWRQCFSIVGLSGLGRYMPGKVWVVVGKIGFLERLGIPCSLAFRSLWWEVVIASLSAGALSIFMPATSGPVPNWWQWCGAGSLAAVAGLAVWVGLRQGAQSARGFLGVVVQYVVMWIAFGIGVFFLARAFVPLAMPQDLLTVVGGYGIAHMAGVVVVLVPNGMGVREGSLLWLFLGTPLAACAALLGLAVRAAVTVFELLFAIMGWRLWSLQPAAASAAATASTDERVPVLLISYNGVLEPIVQSQLLPYARGLQRHGYRFVLLSFEKWHRPHTEMRQAIDQMRQRLKREGIQWYPLRYHKSPTVPATVWDMWCGVWLATWLAWRDRIRLVHARASIAAVMALGPMTLLGARLIFDVRGLNAEEYVDGSGWSRQSLRYKVLKWFEGYLLRAAHEVVVLSETARDLITSEQYVPGTRHLQMTVIPTCVDVKRFAPQPQPACRDSQMTLVYLGSLGTWYLLDEMLQFVITLRQRVPHLGLLCVTQSDPRLIEERWASAGLPAEALTVATAPHDDIPRYVSQGQVGLCFVKPSLSKQASFPTKIGEYLASGLPIVVNARLSNADRFLEERGVGVVVRQFDAPGYAAACDDLLRLWNNPDALQRRCRRVAEEELSLAVGISRYEAIYRRCIPRTLRIEQPVVPAATQLAEVHR